MNGIKNFIVGFSLSLISTSFAGQLYSLSPKQPQYPARNIRIDLFKKQDASVATLPTFKKVSKYSIINTAKADKAVDLPKFDTINSPEDDEILSVNIDGGIPIDYEAAVSSEQAELLQTEENNLVASLPQEAAFNIDFYDTNSPWEIAKGSKHIKNKKLLEETDEIGALPTLNEDIKDIASEDKEVSYKIAEKIKQSIIFPIPDEILSDEDLTPTFIKGRPKKPLTAKPAQTKKTSPQQVVEPKAAEPVKIVKKVPTKEIAKETDSKGILDSLSSWFAPDDEKEEKRQKAKNTPSYSSQPATTANHTAPSSNEDFVSFYETLQETTRHHQQNKVLPSELKLSFQPDRAEISGQTLRWLKAFSEAAQNDNTYLQVRLDTSTPTDIQRKRLNLLYSIFINNGVDTKKIDTVFTSTEPNAFIIRSLTYK